VFDRERGKQNESLQNIQVHNQVKWIFSDVTRRSFHWQAVVSPDKGKTWQLQEEMFVRRVNSAN